HVNMIDRLPALFVAVHDYPKPLAAAQLRGEALGGQEEMAGQCGVAVSQVLKGGDVLFRNDQKVHGRLWIDVMEGDHLDVFVEDASRNLTGNDLAEKAFHGRLQIASRACSVMVLRPTCPTAGGKRPTGALERLDDDQDHDGDQKQDGDFIEPAVERMAAWRLTLGKAFHLGTADMVVADQQHHQGQLGMQPAATQKQRGIECQHGNAENQRGEHGRQHDAAVQLRVHGTKTITADLIVAHGVVDEQAREVEQARKPADHSDNVQSFEPHVEHDGCPKVFQGAADSSDKAVRRHLNGWLVCAAVLSSAVFSDTYLRYAT